jgi:hypothetical protein
MSTTTAKQHFLDVFPVVFTQGRNLLGSTDEDFTLRGLGALLSSWIRHTAHDSLMEIRGTILLFYNQIHPNCQEFPKRGPGKLDNQEK